MLREYSCNKTRYDKKGALTAKNKRYRDEHTKLRIYECPICYGWHLTSKAPFLDVLRQANKWKRNGKSSNGRTSRFGREY